MSKPIADIIKSRISTRAFTNEPVTEDTVRELLEVARWAPSGGNLQPWQVHVVTGKARDRLIQLVQSAIAENPFGDESEISVYPKGLQEPYRTRRYSVAEEMYALLDIPRDDKPARLNHLTRNFKFFDAPVGLFFSLDRAFDRGQWAHLGMFMQTLSLAAEEIGLATCMQEAWCTRASTVSAFLNLKESEQLYCGMALGYPDKSAKVNKLRSKRAAIDEFTTFVEK